MAERTEMGGRDYPADFGTPDPDDVGDRREAERAAWRAGYAVGFDAGRIEASKQGFSDAWDGGWKAAVRYLRKQGWLRVEELADDPEETEEEREAWAKCTPADGVDSPHIGGEPEAGKQVWEQLMEVDASVAAVAERARVKAEPERLREHGVAGVSEYEDLPDWAKRALNKTWAELDDRFREATGGTVEDAVKSVLTEADADVCDSNLCQPVQPGGGWWCQYCDKPLRLVRPLYRSEREEG